MIIVLSPSKSVTDKKPPIDIKQTSLLFPKQANELVKALSKLSKKQIKKELQTSDMLTELNYARYQNWKNTPTRSAIWLYSGNVYNGLDSFTMDESTILYSQKNLLIISGLYGAVRPLDGIRPYRLEMKLPFSGSWGKNLYEAWSDKLSSYIEKTNDTTILMCASKEYSRAIASALPEEIQIVTPRFMQKIDGKLTEKGLFVKYARGALARWVIDKKIENTGMLHEYSNDGFVYSKLHSTENEIVYIVPRNFSLKGRFTKQ